MANVKLSELPSADALDGSETVPVVQDAATKATTVDDIVGAVDADPAGTAASAVATHAADTTAVHGITDTSVLETTTGAQAKVDAAIAALLDSAPGALDTLNELAAAIGDDANYAATITTALAGKAADADVVHDTGNETIAGVKTFSSSPIVPAPTTDLQAATKKYVDDNAGGAVDSVNGDTGTVVLTAADVSALPWPEGLVTVASSGSSEIITLTNTQTVYDVKLDAATVTLTFAGTLGTGAYSFTLLARQDATGGRLVTWPGSVSWGAAGAPTLSTAGDAVDVITFLTVNGGTTWFGFASSATASSGGVAYSGAKAWATSGLSVPTASLTAVLFNSETGGWDVGTWHDNSTNNSRFTVPAGKAGKVTIKGQIVFPSNATGQRQIRVRKNGTTDLAKKTEAAWAGAHFMQIVADDEAIVGDYYQIMAYQDSGGSLSLAASGIGDVWASIEHKGT